MATCTISSRIQDHIAVQKYGAGQPVFRKDDDKLFRGHGRDTDHISLSKQACCVMVRSICAPRDSTNKAPLALLRNVDKGQGPHAAAKPAAPGSMPSISNAVIDALLEFGKIWRFIQSRRPAAA